MVAEQQPLAPTSMRNRCTSQPFWVIKKAAMIKKFEYLLSGSELKKQIYTAKNISKIGQSSLI